MTNIMSYILEAFKFTEVKAQEEKSGPNGQNGQERRQSGTWPRRLSFTPFPKSCTEDEPDEPSNLQAGRQSSITSSSMYDSSEDGLTVEDQCPPSFFMRKITCVFEAGKFGLEEGSLTGVFFGGGWGIYKYLSYQATVLLGQNGKESADSSKSSMAETRGSKTSGSGSRPSSPRSTSIVSSKAGDAESDSTVNENIIFVSACNSAIALGILCTLVLEFIKQFSSKAQSKAEEKSRKRGWLLSREEIEPYMDSEEEFSHPAASENEAFRKKIKCLYEAAKYGTQEGVLSGVFFGGSWGIFKFVSLRSFLILSPSEDKSVNITKHNGQSNEYSSKQNSGNLITGESLNLNSSDEFTRRKKTTEGMTQEESTTTMTSNDQNKSHSKHGKHGTVDWPFRNKTPDSLNSQSSYRKISKSSDNDEDQKKDKNTEYIGYAFMETGSFDDSDDGDPPKSPKNQNERKRRSTESGNGKGKNQSKESSLKSRSQTSDQTSKQGNDAFSTKTNAGNNPENSSEELTMQISMKSVTTSNTTPSLAAVRKILEVTTPSKSLQNDFSSEKKNSVSSKAKTSLELSGGTFRKESKRQSSDSDNKSTNSEPNPKAKLVFNSEETFIVEEYNQRETSEGKRSESTTFNSYDAEEPDHEERSIASTRKSLDVQTTSEILFKKPRKSSKAATGNIWPDQNISKSILRNADSISNSLTISNKSDKNREINNGNSTNEIENSVSQGEQESTDFIESVSQNITSADSRKIVKTTSERRGVINEIAVTDESKDTISGIATSNTSTVRNLETNSNIFTSAESDGKPKVITSEKLVSESIDKSSEGLFGSTTIFAPHPNSVSRRMESSRMIFGSSFPQSVSENGHEKESSQSKLDDSVISETKSNVASQLVVRNSAETSESRVVSSVNRINEAIEGSDNSTVSQKIVGNDENSTSEIKLFDSKGTVSHPPIVEKETATPSSLRKMEPDNISHSRTSSVIADSTSASFISTVPVTEKGGSKTSNRSKMVNKESSRASSTKYRSKNFMMESLREGSDIEGNTPNNASSLKAASSKTLNKAAFKRITSPEIEKSVSSFIQKVNPSSDESSRSSSVVKTSDQASLAIKSETEKSEGNASNNFNIFSALNDNIIVLSACNCAIVLGLVCGVISTTKASLRL